MQEAIGGQTPACKTFEEALSAARGGSAEALETLLGMFHEYLELLAGDELETAYTSPDSTSILTKRTQNEAQREFEQFRGGSSSELRAWLKEILVRNLIEFRGENPGFALWERPTRPGASHLSYDESFEGESNSSGSRLVSDGMEIRILDAIDTLPSLCRTVLKLRHFENRSFHDIELELGQSSEAVRMLWKQALRYLHQKMRQQP